MVRTRIRNHRVGTLRPAWPARPAAARLRRAGVRAHSRSAADPSDPGLRPSAIGRSNHHEFACVAKAKSVRSRTESWLVLTRSSLAGFNPIRDNLVWLDIVDDSVRSFDDLPNLGHFVFRNHAAGERQLANLLRAPRQTVNHSFGIGRRVSRNVAVDRIQVPQSGIGPVDVHSRKPYLRRTSCTSVVLPA